MRQKRINAYLLSAMLVLFTVFPQKSAHAILPALAVTAITSGGAAAAIDAGGTALATLIGASVIALGVAGQLPGQQTASELRIPTTDDPVKQNQVMPPPIVPQSFPPTVGYSYSSSWLPGENFPSAGAACSAASVSTSACASDGNGGWLYPSCSGVSGGPDGSPSCTRTCTCNDQTSVVAVPIAAASTYICGSGYENQNGTCIATKPRLAQTDQKNDVTRTASGFQFGSNYDADAGSSVSPSGAPNAAPSPKVSVVGKNSKGEPVVIEVTRNADASTNVKVSTQSQVSNNTVIKQQDLSISPDSVVVAATESVMAGTVSNLDSANPVVNADPSQKVYSSDIQFPSDYARQGEAANAAAQVKTSVDAITTKLTDTQNVDDPEVPEYANPWGDHFTPMINWQLPGHTSECPTGSFEFNGRAFYFSAHCQLIADYFGAFQQVMNVVWVVLSYLIVMGA